MTENHNNFKDLFENIMNLYIEKKGIPDEMQSLEETVCNILMLVECSVGCLEDVAAIEETLYKILLLGMSIGRRVGDGVEPSPLRRSVELVDKSTQFDHFDHVQPPVMVTSELLINLGNSTDQPTAVRSDPSRPEPTCSIPDDDAEDMVSAEGAGQPDITKVELAEPNHSHVALSQTTKPRRWRLATAWKRVKRVALRLCCVR